MENKTIVSALLISLLFTLSGCEIIGTIFKTGMGVGVIIVVLVIILFFYLFGKKKTE